MNPATWLLAALFLPAVLGAGIAVPRWRRAISASAPLASWPTVLAATAAYGQQPAEFPMLLLGVRIGVDLPGLALITAGAVIWTGAALVWQEPAKQPGFLGGALAAQTGSLGALVALDPVGFYLFFLVMTVASYGLVAAGPRRGAHRAAALYLGLALLGEFLMLTAFMLASAETEAGLVIGLLLLFGLGAKLGIPPFHVALPVAYRAAPTVGGALIGSVLVNAAIVGLMRFLPISGSSLTDLAPVLCGLGLATAFYGALIGTMQRGPKALLGYSTVSQMGIAIVAFGIASAAPDGLAVLAPAIALFAVHHALTKAALFFALAATPGRVSIALIIALSLTLAAAPLTGGALAKLWIEESVYALPGIWSELVHTLLPLTSAGTALLMARFVFLVRRRATMPSSDRTTFLVLAVLALTVPWSIAMAMHPAPGRLIFAPAHLWTSLWPLLAASALLAVAARASRSVDRRFPTVPAGDILILLQPLAGRMKASLHHMCGPLRLPRSFDIGDAFGVIGSAVERGETHLRGFRGFGLSFLALIVVLLIAGEA